MSASKDLIRLYARLTKWISVIDKNFVEEMADTYLQMTEERNNVRALILQQANKSSDDLAYLEWLDDVCALQNTEFQQH